MYRGKVFSPSVGYYLWLCDVPGKKGIWLTGKKVSVPGKWYLPMQLDTFRVYTMYRGQRCLVYRGNGTGAGEKAFGVPGIKHFPAIRKKIPYGTKMGRY